MNKCWLILFSLLVAGPQPVVADEDVPTATLRVRTISATVRGHEADPTVDSRLKDISGKLGALPYGEFSLKSSQQVSVPIRKKRVIKLPGGQQLTLRLLYRNEHKLGIWIDWHDGQGMQLINSKLHFQCSEPVIAGTDNTDGSALLLAIALEDS